MRLPTLALAGLLLGLAAGPAVGQDAPYSRDGADTCLACHENEVVLPIFQGPHANPTDPDAPFGHGQLQCEACHGPTGNHTGRVRRGEERPSPGVVFGKSPVEEQNGMCLGCHESDTGFGWHGGPHDDNTVACADCHTAHTGRDPVLSADTQSEVCFQCHQQQRSETLKPFAHPIRQGKMGCTGCHDPHGSTTELQLARQTINDTCFACHAEKRGPYLWEHAPVTEDCSICHAPHGSNQPGMLTMRAPLLCQGCHSQAGHPSLANDASGLPDATPSQFLLGQSCLNCHTQVHGSNHPSGSRLMR